MAKMQIKSIFFTQLHKGQKNLNDGFLSSPQQVSFGFNCHLGIDAPTHCLVHFNVLFSPVVPLAECIKILKKRLHPSFLVISVSQYQPQTTWIHHSFSQVCQCAQRTDLDERTAYACC